MKIVEHSLYIVKIKRFPVWTLYFLSPYICICIPKDVWLSSVWEYLLGYTCIIKQCKEGGFTLYHSYAYTDNVVDKVKICIISFREQTGLI